MPLRPWIGHEPVSVDQVTRPEKELTTVLYNFPTTNGSVYLTGPGPNRKWYLDTVVLFCATSAVAGTRIYWAYYQDRYGRLIRHVVATLGPSSIAYIILTRGATYGAVGNGVSTFTITGPYYVDEVPNPCQVGAYIEASQLGDTMVLQILAKETDL